VAIFDDTWFTGLQTAATTLGGIAAGGITGALLVWRNVSKTQIAVAKDLGEIEWIRDLKNFGRMEAQLEVAKERLLELANAREKHYAACEERVLLLSAQLLDMKIFNGSVFKELSARDKDCAQRLLDEHLHRQRQNLPVHHEGTP
jgi:hypothetical protein